MRCLVTILGLSMLSQSCSIHFDLSRPQVWAEESESIRLPAQGQKTIDAKTQNGSIVVRAADVDSVEITARKKAGGDDSAEAAERLKDVRIDHEVRGDVVHLSWSGSGVDRDSWIEVSFDVCVPRSMAVELLTYNGSIDVTGVRGDCRGRSHNGSVSVDGESVVVDLQSFNGSVRAAGCPGTIHLQSHNGEVEATLRAPAKVEGSIQTMNGAVTVRMCEGASARLEARSMNGGVSVDVGTIHCSSDRDTIKVDLGAADTTLEVRSMNGAVRIQSL